MEVEKKGILFIAYNAENRAVWNAIKLHVEFAKELGQNISFIVDKKYIDIVKKDYPNSPIYSYSSLLNLAFKLVKLDASYIFSPVMFTTVSTLLAKIFTRKKIFYWVQGAVPEESFLRHSSKVRYYFLSTIEYLALLISHKNIFVSTEMKSYLERKTKRAFTHSVIVPCISEFSYDGSAKEKDSFVYIGGMSAWQRVDIMLQMFNEILKLKPHAHLYIATLEKDKAHQEVKKHLESSNIKSVTVLSINNREEIPHFLSTKEYGFLIREDIVVNNVSSPIKLAEYLSCGVNLIISDAVSSYASIVEEESAGIKISSNDNIIKKLQSFTPNSSASLAVYKKYFSKEAHLSNYKQLLSNNQEEN